MSPRPLRRSQAISPFGVGSMVDFPGPVSLVLCGLDAWPFDGQNPDHEEFKIVDDTRLTARLGVDFFVLPPDYRRPRRGDSASQRNLNIRLPFLRFPRWHTCPRCGRMYEAELSDRAAPRCVGPIGTGKYKGKPHKSRATVQLRFVTACVAGHLQDFPWWEWVLRDTTKKMGLRLRMMTSGSASLAGVQIVCERDSDSCERVAKRTLASAFNYKPPGPSALTKIGVLCRGHNPCLGIPSSTAAAPGCGQNLYPLLRGGSNVYFPRVVSSIYIPPIDLDANVEALEILEDPMAWQVLSMMAKADTEGRVTEDHCKPVLEKYGAGLEVTPAELAVAANRRLHPESAGSIRGHGDTEEQAYRRREYEVLKVDVQEGMPQKNLLIRSSEMSEYGEIASKYLERVSLIHKLRETRAFVGFSRIFPDSSQGSAQSWDLISRRTKNWLPASVVRGEGIFLQLKETLLSEWLEERGEQLDTRFANLDTAYADLRASRHQEIRAISPKFILIHTLAHLLINELILGSGYGSASIRERLYSSDGENPMSGLLLYTAAGDSEGTMGGLVRMGKPRPLERILGAAIEKAHWCSTDPVCIQSRGQGPDSCNLAACHSCALLPETACEEQNKLLDRGVVVGTLNNRDLGFFS